MTRHRAFESLLGLAVTLLASGMASAADAKARARLDEVARVYRGLAAYADHGEFVLTLTIDGATRTLRQPAAIALARPNRLRIDAGVTSLACDGKMLTTLVLPAKKYATEPAPPRVTLATVTAGPVGSVLLGGPSGPPLSIVLGLLLADDPTRAVLDLGDDLASEPDRLIDGTPCEVLRIASSGGTAYRLCFDTRSKLIRAIEVSPDSKALAALFPTGTTVKVDAYRWSSGAVSDAPPASLFVVEAPRDFGKVGALARGGSDDGGVKFKVHDLVGKEAPAFTLTLLDDAGKTRTVARTDLTGKVVVLDFWATWCGPCLSELPEVQKLVEGYARAKKDVVVVALSEDSRPNDLDDVRKLVESTLATKKITLAVPPVGLVGLDPSNAVGEAFKVEGYPTVVVLDARGLVRAAHVGFSPDVGKTLASEIDALLEGKPLPKEEKKEQGK